VIIAVISLSIIIGTQMAFSRPHYEVTLTKEEVMAKTMIRPVVRLNLKRGMGSGVIIKREGDYSFVITNEHVIRSSIATMKVPGGDVQMYSPIQVTINIPSGRSVVSETVSGMVYAYSDEYDLALIRIKYNKIAPAILLEPEEIKFLEPGFSVGYPLGSPHQVPTPGMVSDLNLESNSMRFIGISAPIVNGNSGGGFFVLRKNRYKLAAIPTMVRMMPVMQVNPAGGMHPQGRLAVTVPHMGICVPMERIHLFLDAVGVKL
jgi:S1-C subfamily serine protease